jgi:selenide,water dikinase
MGRNRDYFEQWVHFEAGLDKTAQNLLFDPETSGGLLIAVPAAAADSLTNQLRAGGDRGTIVGEVKPGEGYLFVGR